MRLLAGSVLPKLGWRVPTLPLQRAFHAARSSRASDKPYYVTTPLFYVNAEPHIGHLHSLVLADVLTRFRHLRNPPTSPKPILLTGTDEHGMKIQKAAHAQGLTPRDLCDKVSKRFEALADVAGLDYDIFYRTSTAQHADAVQHIWRELARKDYIYKAHYEGWYSVSDETYYTENQVHDQVGPAGTVVKVSVESGQPVEWQQEENYMFRLSAFRDRLLTWLENNPKAVQPESRYNEVLTYLRAGPLSDLSISRPRSRLEWGVQVPDDPTHTIYVWIDALSNYLVATGFPQQSLESCWPADVHVVGKDIIRFHAVYWPAMLMALDLPLPKTVLAHAHWTMDQMKMSKSRGNVVNPFDSIIRYSKDGIRCFLMFRGGLDTDADFAERHVERDYQKYLAGQTGNLLQRLESKSLLKKMALASAESDLAPNDEISDAVLASIAGLPGLVNEAMDNFRPSNALKEIFDLLGQVNVYISKKRPWAVTDAAELAQTFSVIIEALRICSLLLQAFIPDSAKVLQDRLGIPLDARTWENATSDERHLGMERFPKSATDGSAKNPLFGVMKDAAGPGNPEKTTSSKPRTKNKEHTQEKQ